MTWLPDSRITTVTGPVVSGSVAVPVIRTVLPMAEAVTPVTVGSCVAGSSIPPDGISACACAVITVLIAAP